MKWTLTAFCPTLAEFARTAIIAPVEPANAVATGTTQNPLFGPTAQDSSIASPELRGPRVATAATRRTHKAPARTSGPTNCPNEVRRQAATSERVAEVRRICTRSTTGHAT